MAQFGSGPPEHGFRVRLSPGGKPFFTPSPRTLPVVVRMDNQDAVYLEDLSIGKELRRLPEPRKQQLDAVVFAPDGRRLLVLGEPHLVFDAVRQRRVVGVAQGITLHIYDNEARHLLPCSPLHRVL
jgi:hypothetical protein